MSTATQPPPYPFATPGERLRNAVHIAGAVRLADVKSENTRWLWPGRIPLGRVTLLVSDPGLGKSLLALDIAARVSTGAPWPDSANAECGMGNGEVKAHHGPTSSDIPHSTLPIPHSSSQHPPSSILLLTSEDDLAETIRPRLEALGADLQKIVAIANVPGENAGDAPRAFALNRDLARLRHLLDAIPDCRLLIIDPISAFLGTTNEHGNADIRMLLAALTTIARERNLAVLIVSHLRKKEGAAIHRTMGSLAFVATARAAWALCKDPAEENRRLLLPLKNNLARKNAGLAFTIESSADHDAPVIRWSSDKLDIAPDNYFAPPSRPRGRPDDDRQFAMGWLKEKLAEAPLLVKKVQEDAAAFGITYGTLRRAFRSLDGEPIRAGFPFKSWHWKLPTTAQKYEGEFCALNTIDAELSKIIKDLNFNHASPKPTNSPPNDPNNPVRTGRFSDQLNPRKSPPEHRPAHHL